MKKIGILLLSSLLLLSCGASPTKESGAEPLAEQEPGAVEQQAEPTRHDKVYYFQHRLIPDWLYNSEGLFFEDLTDDYSPQLISVAEEIVDAEFAAQLKVEFVPRKNAALFIFEQPNSPPNCYFAIAQKLEDGFRYTTYESTMPFGDDVYGVVGGWNENGDHLNMGARTYSTKLDFLMDVLEEE
jgi:hypothetical protein